MINTSYEIDWKSRKISEFLYYLPLDIKKKIFYICVCNNMYNWSQDHYNLMWSNIKCNNLYRIKVNKPKYNFWDDYILLSSHENQKLNNTNIKYFPEYSCLEIIKLTGLKYRKSCIDWGEPERCIRIPVKYTNRLCRQKKTIKNVPPHKFIINEKVDTYRIDTQLISELIYKGIFMRKLAGTNIQGTHEYWVENKCRCYTCDLVRFVYRSISKPNDIPSKAWSLEKSVTIYSPSRDYISTGYIEKIDWHNTYDDINWDGGKQWINVKFAKFTKKQKKSIKKQCKLIK